MFWEVLTRKPKHREFWALKDISFEVKRGEVLGIIGRNGAGKSTLLKILAGTLDKNSGEVDIHGKVSAILELGTGFHGEYTGRENVFMGGMCLGMSREEIEKKLDWIIDFSELRDVIDQPFKTYSSGMQARLTFSTAVSVDPDVFMIDEALAAGDMLFQEKCFRRIREIVDNGATVLFVTHSLGLIYEFCDSCLLLSQGSLVLKDESRLVGYEYEKILAEDRQAQSSNAATLRLSVSSSTENSVEKDEELIARETEMLSDEDTKYDGSLKAEILSYELLNEQDTPVRTLVYGNTYLIRMTVFCHSEIDSMSLSFRLEKPSGLVVYGLSTILSGEKIRGYKGKTVCVDFTLPCFLQAGNYLLGGGVAEMVADAQFNVLHIVRGAVEFEVCGQIQFQGVADLQSEVTRISTQHAELNGGQG